jgi:hypothetical protein
MAIYIYNFSFAHLGNRVLTERNACSWAGIRAAKKTSQRQTSIQIYSWLASIHGSYRQGMADIDRQEVRMSGLRPRGLQVSPVVPDSKITKLKDQLIGCQRLGLRLTRRLIRSP